MKAIKVTTLNLQGFINWESRNQAILNYMQSEGPDIAFFQEVVYLSGTSPYNQAQLLNQQLGYAYEQSAVTRLQPSTVYAVFREGLAAISKYPIIKSDTLVLQQEPGDEHNRIIQLLDIQIDNQIVKFVNVHFSLTDYDNYATAHLKETLEILASRGEERIIVGDFNMNYLEELEYLWGAQYKASTYTPYVSFASQNKRVDYFLIPKAYEFASLSTSGDTLSDHRAVSAVLTDSASAAS